ncbi:hypothetical protein ACHAWF_008963 [Thalassiosira exigua]
MATEEASAPATVIEEEEEAAGSAKKAKKKKKKQSKKRRRDADAEVEAEGEPYEVADVAEAGVAEAGVATDAPAAADAARRKSDRAARRSAKESERARLLALIPAKDPDGIPYGKLQIRRMMRRAKHGLDPIATEEEEREMREREGRERREEEALYANDGDDGDEAGGGDGEEDEEGAGGGADGGEEGGEAVPSSPRSPPPPRKKKRPRSKPVPSDYVCMACRNECPDFAPHWIYDCPMKRTERGCNKVAKRLRGLNEPDERKVFVSGLPFDCDEGGVERFFAEGVDSKPMVDSKPIHCKLLRFEDSKRCKGQAFLTFASDEGATRALTLSGSPWRDVEEPGTSRKTKKGKKKDEKEDGGRKELRLKVTRVLNRRATKARGKTSK